MVRGSSPHNDKVLGGFSGRTNDVSRFKITGPLLVDVKDLEGVLDNLVEIHQEVMRIAWI
jgi:hypothetical protein